MKSSTAPPPREPDAVLDAPPKGGKPPLTGWAPKMVRALDELVPIPGTEQRVGIDALVGFFLPGAGDVVTGAGSVSLLFLALENRVPTVVIGRMLVNIFFDMILGAVPFVGDVFDVFFRSNRRNLDLIEKYRTDPSAKPSKADYVLVALGVTMALATIALPFLIWGTVGAGLVAGLRELLSSPPPPPPPP